MNNEDMSEMIQKLSEMMNHSMNNHENDPNQINQDDVSSNPNELNEDILRNMMNQFSSHSNSSTKSDNMDNYNFNFDMNTILKMKNIMDKVNSNKNDPRSNLLLSLKPYLNHQRKEKLDQYIQFLNISKIIDAFQSDNGAKSK